MKRFQKSISIILVVLMTISLIPMSVFAENWETIQVPIDDENETVEITLELLDGEEFADRNWYLFNSAVSRAQEGKTLLIKVEPAGTYYIGKLDSPAAIRLRSNTIVDLGGSALIRYNQMGNFFQNCDMEGDPYNGTGYNLSENITIKNGSIDGTQSSDEIDNVNLLNFGHAKGISIDNISVSNRTAAHLIEFSGCCDCSVTNCTFTGVSNNEYTSPVEAVQLDICDYNSGGKSWNGIYSQKAENGDETPCRDILIDNCVFRNYPSAIGNHKGIKGVFTKGVTITNCDMSTENNSLCSAIWAYNFSDSLISNNKIYGNYKNGIYVSGGDNLSVVNNNIKTTGSCLYVTVASSSYIPHSGGKQGEEYVSKCKIIGNTLTNTGTDPAFCGYTGSHIAEISGNKITSPAKERAMTFTSNAKVDLIKSNTLSASKSIGLHISDSAVVKKIVSNTISAKSNAVFVGKGAKVTELSSNKLSSSANNTIQISASAVNLIQSNTITKSYLDGIAVIASAKVTSILKNSISNSGDNGIRVSTSNVSNINENKILSSKKNAVYISNSAKVTNIKTNYVKAANQSGIYVTGATATTISYNFLLNCKKGGIKVTSSGKTSTVFANAVHGAKDYAISLTNRSLKVTMGNNVSKSNSKGIYNSGKTKNANKAGFQKIYTYYYHFNSKGAVKVGLNKIKNGGKTYTYYFNSNGIMQKGWQKIKNKNKKTYVYYFKSNGVMQTGTAVIDKKTYKFKSSGICTNPPKL